MKSVGINLDELVCRTVDYSDKLTKNDVLVIWNFNNFDVYNIVDDIIPCKCRWDWRYKRRIELYPIAEITLPISYDEIFNFWNDYISNYILECSNEVDKIYCRERDHKFSIKLNKKWKYRTNEK